MTVHVIPGDQSFPAAQTEFLDTDIAARLGMEGQPPVRILLLYGSLRERSYSRLLVEEAARLLQRFGAETRIFDPRGLPHADDVGVKNHPKVKELLELSLLSEGHVWCSPERHGTITGLIKTQMTTCRSSAAGFGRRKDARSRSCRLAAVRSRLTR